MKQPSALVRPKVPVVMAALGAGLLGLSPRPASAQAIDGEFSVQRFDPAPGPRNYFTTRGARTDGEKAWSAGLFANYAFEPFTVVSCESRTNCDDPNAVRKTDTKVVENLFSADLLGSFTIIPRLQLGLKVPLSFSDGQGIDNSGASSTSGLQGFGLGDLQLEGKVRAYGEVKDPFVVGATLFGTAPLGTATAEGKYIGDSSPTVGARGIFDGAQGPFSFGGNLAGIWRQTGRVGSTEIGPEFRYNVAAGFAVSPVLRILAEGYGGTKFSSKNGTNSLEIDGGLQITPLGSPVTINVGGGTGVIQGVGVPTARAFLGVMYVKESGDRDDDGIGDGDDQCPTEPEDRDDYEDSDGCPDTDNDQDAVADAADKCPSESEDSDGFEDTDGCPDPDNDKDAVPDHNDRCPLEAETKNGFRDEDGCPDEADADKDGVPDSKDKCPNDAEDTDGFEDTDGCPDPDNDKDGIPDDRDECIDEPETMNGNADEDGCPDQGEAKAEPKAPPAAPKLVEVKGDTIELKAQVNFATASSKIVGARSFKILDEAAAVLIANPRFENVTVEGHTDSKGDSAKNKKLSQGRAQAVVDYLIKKKVEAGRLKAIGYGDEKPIDTNDTADGRARNRRVAFTVEK